jgi:hypothetical protein
MFILLTANAFASQFTMLPNFLAKPAEYPNSGLIIGPDGGFSGTAGISGGSQCSKLCGVVFEIKQTSTGWQYQVIHNFHGPKHDGELPFGPLLFDSVGNLSGTTSSDNSTCFTQRLTGAQFPAVSYVKRLGGDSPVQVQRRRRWSVPRGKSGPGLGWQPLWRHTRRGRGQSLQPSVRRSV